MHTDSTVGPPTFRALFTACPQLDEDDRSRSSRPPSDRRSSSDRHRLIAKNSQTLVLPTFSVDRSEASTAFVLRSWPCDRASLRSRLPRTPLRVRRREVR